jgi:hypothetical protein
MTTRFIVDPRGDSNQASNFLDVLDAPTPNAQSVSNTDPSDYIFVGGVGPTSGRAAWIAGPAVATAQAMGFRGAPAANDAVFYFDTTLNKLIYTVDSGANWRDPATGSTV